MKKALVILALVLLSSIPAHAQTDGGTMGDQQGQDKGMMGGAASAGTATEEQKGGHQQTQEKSEAGVTVKIAREGTDGVMTFKVVLETHTADLEKYKFEEIIVLRADGKEYRARVKSQEGSGHHRSAVVEFDNPVTKEFDVVVKDVAGVKERMFTF